MPEGPEVHTMSDELQTLIGTEIVEILIDSNSRYKDGIDEYEELTKYLPLSITWIGAIGKKLIFSLGDRDRDKWYIISSLGMEGRWSYNYLGSNTNLIIVIKSRDTAVQKEFYLYFDDSRHFGTFKITRFFNVYDKLGTDPLIERFTFSDWKRDLDREQSGKHGYRPIADTLIDQSFISGIGNYLRAEILYRAKVAPNRPIVSINQNESRNIWRFILDVMKESYNCGGFTLRTYQRPNGQKGGFIPKIYNRRTDPDGRRVERWITSDRRSVFWVPEVQK